MISCSWHSRSEHCADDWNIVNILLLICIVYLLLCCVENKEILNPESQSNDLNREILASNLFNCHKEVINAPPVPSISRCIHIVYWLKNVWEYQWSNFIYNCMSTFLHYVRCKDALLDCSAPGGERCESLTWVDEIHIWWWNDAYSLMMLRRGALLFFKVIHQISRSHGSKKRQIWPRLGFSGL